MKSGFRFIVTISIACVLGCGGGGGGGGGDGENARTGIRVVQGSLDIAPLDLFASSQVEATVRQAKFASPSLYGALDEGVHSIIATKANRPNDRFTSHQVNVSDQDRFTLLTFGNTTGLGLNSRVLTDSVPVLDGQAAIRIVHGLSGADSVVASATALGGGVAVSYGADSGYKIVSPGLIKISFTRGVDRKSLGSVSLEVFAGGAYSVFALGEVDIFSALRVARDD